MKNRFNRLTSKEWLPFQKSWFRYTDDEKLYREYLRFFCRAEETDEKVLYIGPYLKLVSNIANEENISVTEKVKNNKEQYQYVMVDLRDQINAITSIDQYKQAISGIIQKLIDIRSQIVERRFLTIFIPNTSIDNAYFPWAWHAAYQLSNVFSLKDEKIACTEINIDVTSEFSPRKSQFYVLHFRNDENAPHLVDDWNESSALDIKDELLQPLKSKAHSYPNQISSWFILKPQPRKKNEILHPAKYPEELVKMHIEEFTREGDYVMDPMSGTGSTLIAALQTNRNACGTELSEFFADIARQRCEDFKNPMVPSLFGTEVLGEYKLINKDAALITKKDFPQIDYVITSPPYWDMLNMKGAENQAKRIEKGLQTNYSDRDDDLGNIADYQAFLDKLMNIYYNLYELLSDGGHMTIIVKNIKKKGRNYPFAWDICRALESRMTLLPETFWCQDDINLAPYGYGNTFVSNTFHQYCLNFRK